MNRELQWPSVRIWPADTSPAADTPAADACSRCGELLPPGETAYIRRGQVWCPDCNRRWPPWSALAPATWRSRQQRKHRGRDSRK